MAGKTIGELNGRWAMLLKIVLALCPFAVGGCAWLVAEVYAIQTSRFTDEDGEQIKARIREVEQSQAAAPSKEWMQHRFDRQDDMMRNHMDNHGNQ